MNLLQRASAGPETPEQRQQKARAKSTRLERVRQARTATRSMQRPEPSWGLSVAGFLVAIGLVSYLGTDVAKVAKKVAGKSVTVTQTVHHPETAVILILLAVVAAVTIYWRRRLVTGIVFMLAAAIGVGTPFPKSLSDASWAAFLVPAGYVLWMLIFRMN
ncbi:MAG: hypothetical protein ACRDZX_00315, partial [Acidimicrobiales bacterium]